MAFRRLRAMATLKCVRCGRSVDAAQVPSDGQIVCECGYRISVPRGHFPADTTGTTSKPPNVAKAVLIGLGIAVVAAIPIGHSLHQAWAQNAPSGKSRAVARPTLSEPPQLRVSMRTPAEADTKPNEQAQVVTPPSRRHEGEAACPMGAGSALLGGETLQHP